MPTGSWMYESGTLELSLDEIWQSLVCRCSQSAKCCDCLSIMGLTLLWTVDVCIFHPLTLESVPWRQKPHCLPTFLLLPSRHLARCLIQGSYLMIFFARWSCLLQSSVFRQSWVGHGPLNPPSWFFLSHWMSSPLSIPSLNPDFFSNSSSS